MDRTQKNATTGLPRQTADAPSKLQLLTVTELDQNVDRPFRIILILDYSNFPSAANAFFNKMFEK